MEILVTQALATWYLAHALTKTHGLFGMFIHLRNLDQRVGLKLLECIVCTAFWVSVVLSIAVTRLDVVATIASAGLAMLAHKYTGWDYGQ